MSMPFQKLKKFLSKLRYLPLHPQWFVFLNAKKHYQAIGQQATGVVLDIGCADQYMKHYISSEHTYIGLDYYQTSTQWYKTHPDVYADAQSLPIADNSIDTVLLLDVLEHLPNPDKALEEIKKALKTGGHLIINVPFLYPLHDEPLDFQRWTQHGLQQLAYRHGFQLRKLDAWGHPLETAALLTNIALSKTLLNWMKQKNPLLILAIVLPLFILLINISAYVLARLSLMDSMMPHGYRLTLEKQ